MGRKREKSNSELMHDFCTQPGNDGQLVFVRSVSCFYRLIEGKYYAPVDSFSMKRAIHSFLVSHPADIHTITTAKVKDILDQIALYVPCLNDISSSEYIAFKDCLLSMKTFETSTFDTEKKPTFYLDLPYEEIKKAQAPSFQAFLRSSLVEEDNLFEPDCEQITVVQEMMGYCLMPDMHAASAFFLVGDGANGKSVLSGIITHIIGQRYVSAMNIESLSTDRFAVANLVGKKVNICNEEESKYIKSDRFKALISGDTVTGERKYGDPFEFSPQVKFIFCSNAMPTFDGLNYGIRRRMKIISFFRRFEPQERDIHLSEKLKEEIPGIIAWALEGARRLRERNFHFSDIDSRTMQRAMEEFENDASSAVRFFHEFYEIDNTQYTHGNTLYEEYAAWCRSTGRKPLNDSNFGKDLKAVGVRSYNKKISGSVLKVKNVVRKSTQPVDLMDIKTTKEIPIPNF